MKDEIADLAAKALKFSLVRDELLTYPICEGTPDSTTSNNQRADIKKPMGERGQCLDRHRGHRHQLKISQIAYPPSSSRHSQTLEKKKHLRDCQHQRRNFTPFIVTTGGLLGNEAASTRKRLASLPSGEWEKPYTQVCGWVRSCITISMVRGTN